SIAQPFAGDVGPDLIVHPGLFLVADPAGFAREHKCGLAVHRNQHVYITVNDFETGGVEDCAFESSVLVAADNEGVEVLLLHSRANVFVAAIDFFLTWQSALYPCTPHNSAAINA